MQTKKLSSAIALIACLSTANAQMLRSDINLSDPAIMADPVTKNYYMTGTAGDIFKSADLELWTTQPWALRTGSIAWVERTIQPHHPAKYGHQNYTTVTGYITMW